MGGGARNGRAEARLPYKRKSHGGRVKIGKGWNVYEIFRIISFPLRVFNKAILFFTVNFVWEVLKQLVPSENLVEPSKSLRKSSKSLEQPSENLRKPRKSLGQLSESLVEAKRYLYKNFTFRKCATATLFFFI